MFILDDLPCSLPTTPVPDTTDVPSIAKEFEQILQGLDGSRLAINAIWRDLFALTGSARTFYQAEAVYEKWTAFTGVLTCSPVEYKQGSAKTVQLGTDSAWIEAEYSFDVATKPARACIAILSLVLDGGEWKIWVIRTILDQLKGHPDVDRLRPNPTSGPASQPGSEDTSKGNVFECAVIGAGQAGLSVAGRLKALGVTYVVLEKNRAVGDNWALRYKSTKRRPSCSPNILLTAHQ